MVNADGVVKDEEMAILLNELLKFGVPSDQAAGLIVVADAMDVPTMFQTLTDLPTESKKYVAGYLATIMIADGDIDDSEVKIWQLISTLSQFPTMNIRDAVNYWRNH
jgi:uncharacterized tellurite resistance protein B-like protein